MGKRIAGKVEVPDSGHGRLRAFVGGKNIAKWVAEFDGEYVVVEVRSARRSKGRRNK